MIAVVWVRLHIMACRGWNEKAGRVPAPELLHMVETGASQNPVAVRIVGGK